MKHLKDQFSNCFRSAEDSKIFRIKINGNFVTVNGKSVWHGIGAAKKALRYNCKHNICSIILKDMGIKPCDQSYYLRTKAYDDFYDWAVETGFVEFVQLDKT